ncbi:DNA polymerase III subunit chi [Candidatus Methylopumilus rimovensis]|jgi:DNA polymerase-3 subunit chi|uniref:DNA polymerase III subunit chi n=1 Tax=Candidatus Methylopumilus rimovensis TaxID=2588535 RepID=A0AAE6FU27_9PROT|nr:DNA polymerase III subunit chi [Candidatus Methylopumilus rimovensis]QDD12686.1 DNA polymerase III subunit chi [Candidatus Methylopumilus rimovensis]QDD13990.1 DNA polymerase III subunit chi [Candidatus Methylopumilus rimovensis]
MTYIDFYFNVENKFNKIHEIIEREIVRKRKIFIHVDDLNSAKALSDFLYTASLASFLPHSVGHYEEMTPIHIDWDHKFVSDDFMINLKSEILPSFSRYLRLIEIVSQNEEDKKTARDRLKFYRDRGYEIQLIDAKKEM